MLNLIDAVQYEISRLLQWREMWVEKETGIQRVYPGLFGGRWRQTYVLHRPSKFSSSTFIALLNHTALHLRRASRQPLSPFQMLFLVVMRFVHEIAPGFACPTHCPLLWDASYNCCRRLHGHCVCVRHKRPSPLTHWTGRDSLRKSMPHQFTEVYVNALL